MDPDGKRKESSDQSGAKKDVDPDEGKEWDGNILEACQCMGNSFRDVSRFPKTQQEEKEGKRLKVKCVICNWHNGFFGDLSVIGTQEYYQTDVYQTIEASRLRSIEVAKLLGWEIVEHEGPEE